MPDKQWNADARVERVREISARIYNDVVGESTREVMHAMALVTGVLIKQNYRGLGQDRALSSHALMVRRHVGKDQ
jgi:hypothetical protein